MSLVENIERQLKDSDEEAFTALRAWRAGGYKDDAIDEAMLPRIHAMLALEVALARQAIEELKCR